MMRLDQLCWLSTAAYGMHIVEEFTLDWRDWAHSLYGVMVEWDMFYVTNALVVVLGAICALLARDLPVVALAFPALMLINATFFHVGTFLWTKGRFSPGLFTAVLLFFPLGLLCYRSANEAGVLSGTVLAGSFGIGAGLMAFPFVLLKLKSLPYFQQKA